MGRRALRAVRDADHHRAGTRQVRLCGVCDEATYSAVRNGGHHRAGTRQVGYAAHGTTRLTRLRNADHHRAGTRHLGLFTAWSEVLRQAGCDVRPTLARGTHPRARLVVASGPAHRATLAAGPARQAGHRRKHNRMRSAKPNSRFERPTF